MRNALDWKSSVTSRKKGGAVQRTGYRHRMRSRCNNPPWLAASLVVGTVGGAALLGFRLFELFATFSAPGLQPVGLRKRIRLL